MPNGMFFGINGISDFRPCNFVLSIFKGFFMGFQEFKFEDLPNIMAENNRLLSEVKVLLATATAPQKEPSDIMDLTETCQFLGLTPATLYSKVSRKEIPSYKYGKKLRFSRKQLTELIESNRRSTVMEIGKNAVLQAAQCMQKGNGAA